jgi:hypothetical protein
MPSGYTHMFLIEGTQDKLTHAKDRKLKDILASEIHFLQVGSIAPDLAYFSQLAGDILKKEEVISNAFHFERTNQVPLLMLERARHLHLSGEAPRTVRVIFCMAMGYASHVIADGVIHPFVRDMVGEYKENQKAHQVLEMAIDVLLCDHLTKISGEAVELNFSAKHNQLRQALESPLIDRVCEEFCLAVEAIYPDHAKSVGLTPRKIKGWISALETGFGLATGNFPQWHRNISVFDKYAFKNIGDLLEKKDEFLVLRKPKDRAVNFAGGKEINFLEDCVPRFYEAYLPFARKAFSYVFEDGSIITSGDFPAINLDNGRPLQSMNDLSVQPVYWEV